MMMMMSECRNKMSSAVVALRRCCWLLMTLALSLSLGHIFCATETSEHSKDSGFQQQQQQRYIGDVGLEEEWGLPDTVATVGRLFYYQLPKHHATLGNFTNYKVTVAKEDNLPSWLTFSEQTSSIEGVPMKTVAGQTYILLVLADRVKPSDGGGGGRVIPVKEYFTIRVSDREDIMLSSGEDYMPLTQVPSNRLNDFRHVKCQPNAAVTTATVIVDADEGSFLAKERVNLLRKFSSHLGLPVSMVHLAPSRDDRPIFDDSALVAGPGDIKHPKHTGLLVQWNVGCGNVFAEHMPILELLEVTSSNGSMTKTIGCGVVGWHITSKRPQQTRRLKRQVHFNNPTATAMPSVVRPTGRPQPTMTVPDTASSTDIPETRIVPTTISSVSPDSPIKPTRSPIPTTTYVTITPTRVLSTTTSTVSVIKSSSTAAPSFPVIEASIGTEDTTVRFDSTEVLPSGMSVFPSHPGSVTSLSATSPKLPTSKATKRPPKTPKPLSTETPNQAPFIKKPLAIVDAVVGNLLTFRIPDDLFMDVEDGGAENLTLLLLVDDDQMVEPPSWIKLNETSRTLYGLPLDENIGMHHYQLAAADRQGKLVKTPCNVSVQPRPASSKPNHELSVTLDLDFEKVAYDLETRVNLINKIAAAFGDKDASKMIITSISRGSVVITWTNNTIPFEPCPEKEIRALLAYLLLPDGAINETFAKAMEPYRVLNAGASHIGPCAHLDSHKTTAEPDEITTSVMPKGVEVKPREQPESNLLLLILIPLVIVAVLLLILIIICVLCYKKQKRRQKEQDKLSGLHKGGIPIIFADELDDKPDTPTSTLKSRSRNDEEKQSVPPPEYPRSKPASQSSTLRSDYKSPLLTDNEEDEEQDEQEEELGNGTAPPTLPTRRPRLTQQDNQ